MLSFSIIFLQHSRNICHDHRIYDRDMISCQRRHNFSELWWLRSSFHSNRFAMSGISDNLMAISGEYGGCNKRSQFSSVSKVCIVWFSIVVLKNDTFLIGQNHIFLLDCSLQIIQHLSEWKRLPYFAIPTNRHIIFWRCKPAFSIDWLSSSLFFSKSICVEHYCIRIHLCRQSPIDPKTYSYLVDRAKN